MSLRISSLALFVILLTGCGTGSPAPEGERVDCAIGAGADYSTECVLEHVGPDQFVIHGPNGGFRRFTSVSEGGKLSFEVSDGAAEVAIINTGSSTGPIEFSVESDVYRVDPSLMIR